MKERSDTINRKRKQNHTQNKVFLIYLEKNLAMNTLFRAYNLMMNKITRSLIDIVNKIKKCKI